MKAALVTPFVSHLPLYPSSYVGYGAAVLKERFELDVIDLNADIYFKNRNRLRKLLYNIDREQVIFDEFDLYPLYYKLMKGVEKEYGKIPWGQYRAVFVTIPAWFVNVPTENVLKLTHVIRKEAPDAEVFFFGNSLGSWTDQKRLKENGIKVVHLNDLFELNPMNEPVDYDSLPTPLYEFGRKYIFDIIPIRFKHGCTWGKCKFCSLAKGWNSGYKERSAKRVIQEVEELDRKYNPIMFVCNDNSITGKNLLEICRLLEGVNKPWGAMGRADLTKKEIAALHKAGCTVVYFGLESGSDRVLHEINKGISSRQMSYFVKELYNNNIMPAPSFFVGSPGESESDFEKTLEFISDHRDYLDMINVYPLAMTPASEFSIAHKQPNREIFIRLAKLINLCTGLGMRVCVGEQCSEYAIIKEPYPCDVTY